MDLSSIELHVFVSLTVILGTALVALVVDYLKGNNENLREYNIELRVRREEEARRSLTEIRLLREQMVASADLVTHIERPREAEAKHEAPPVVVNVAPSPPPAQAPTPEIIEEAVQRAVRSATLEMSAEAAAQAAAVPPEPEPHREATPAPDRPTIEAMPAPDSLLDHVIVATLPGQAVEAPEVELEKVVIYAKKPAEAKAAEPGRVVFVAPVEEPAEAASQAAAPEPAQAAEVDVEWPAPKAAAPAPAPVEITFVPAELPPPSLPAAPEPGAGPAVREPEAAPLAPGEVRRAPPGEARIETEAEAAAPAAPAIAGSGLRVVVPATPGVVEEVTLGEPEPASFLPAGDFPELRDSAPRRSAAPAEFFVESAPAPELPVRLVSRLKSPAAGPPPAPLLEPETETGPAEGAAPQAALPASDLPPAGKPVLPEFQRLAAGVDPAAAGIFRLEAPPARSAAPGVSSSEASPLEPVEAAPMICGAGLIVARTPLPTEAAPVEGAAVEPAMAGAVRCPQPEPAAPEAAAVTGGASAFETAPGVVSLPVVPLRVAPEAAEPAAAGRFESPAPEAAPPAAAILSGVSAPAAVTLPAVLPSVRLKARAPEPAAAGRFELQAPGEAEPPIPAILRHESPVEQIRPETVLPRLPSRLAERELAAAGRFVMAEPEEAIPPVARPETPETAPPASPVVIPGPAFFIATEPPAAGRVPPAGVRAASPGEPAPAPASERVEPSVPAAAPVLPRTGPDVTIIEPLPAGFFTPLLGSAEPDVFQEIRPGPIPAQGAPGPRLIYTSGLVVRREAAREVRPVLVKPAPEWPRGLCDPAAIERLIAEDALVTGVVVAIGINDYERIQKGQSKGDIAALGEAIETLIRGMLTAGDFAYRRKADEYILVFTGEKGAAAQKRIHQVAERLWDFQLRSLISYSVLFSWGAVTVSDESFPEAVAQAVEEMNQTRDSRRGFDVGGVKSRRRAVNF